MDLHSSFAGVIEFIASPGEIVGEEISEKSLSIDQEETEVDSPCWRGTQSHKSVASDKNGREVEEKSSSSLQRSLSSTFLPLCGEFSITDPSEAENTRIGVMIHDVDESLGLVSEDSLSNTMSMLDISNEYQKSRKLDPLAPVFCSCLCKTKCHRS